MSSFGNWLSSVVTLGVSDNGEDEINRRIIFSNVAFVSMPVVYSIFLLIDFKSYLVKPTELRFDQLVVPLIIAMCLLNLWLNYKHKTTISRIIFIVLWPILLHLIPIKLLNTPSDYYLAYPFGIVFHAILVQLIFSYKEETVLFGLFMLINVVGLISAPWLLTHFDLDKDIPANLINYDYYWLDCILYWLLFNLLAFYVVYVVHSYIIQLKLSNELIEEQKEELNAVNQNLELIVAKRTLAVQEQNEKLKQHAYFNAHLLRGPFCRIQGLIQLQNLDIDPSLNAEITSHLKQSIEELDSRIKEIQKLVETNDEE